jgi:hypothetical protein
MSLQGRRGSILRPCKAYLLYHTARVLSIVTCTFCHGTGVVLKIECNADLSVFCSCPVGEGKRQRVIQIVERSLKKTA